MGRQRKLLMLVVVLLLAGVPAYVRAQDIDDMDFDSGSVEPDMTDEEGGGQAEELNVIKVCSGASYCKPWVANWWISVEIGGPKLVVLTTNRRSSLIVGHQLNWWFKTGWGKKGTFSTNCPLHWHRASKPDMNQHDIFLSQVF
jgi:hypothetical protein